MLNFTQNRKVDDKVYIGLETKGGKRDEKIQSSGLQLGADEDLINKVSSRCNMGKNYLGVSYSVSEI